jgi:NhaP-type Na+/H+ or K+/H+ antiporter
MEHSVILLLAAIGMLSLLSQWLAWWTNLPAILFLLLSGLVMGPGLGLLSPDDLFGGIFFPFVSLAVAVILFEGSLTLHREDIRGHGSVVRNMVSVGFFVTWMVTALAARYLVNMSWPIAWLFGAIMVVTGPTVIVPMVRAVRPNHRIANILRWEGILIDPVGAILAVLTYEVILATGVADATGEAVVGLLKMVLAGVLTGAAFGYAWGYALRAMWVPDYLQNVATLLLVFACFAIADTSESEAGLLAVTVMGVWLANMRGVHLDDILDFKESLSLLLISGLFILLAARLNFDQVLGLGWGGLGVLLAIQFVARPLKILVCAQGSDLDSRERIALSWIAPRGIIAAAISALLAIRLETAGYADAGLLVPLTFVIIVGTVVFQSLTAGALVRWLGVAAPPAEGLLIAGSGPVPRTIAEVMQKNELPVLVADSSWDGIRAARMAGLPTYFGNPTSDHADRQMNLTGIGKLLALSRRPDLNDLLCTHFAAEFGRDAVYTMPQTLDDADQRAEKYAVAAARRGRRAFAADLSLAKFSSLLSQGHEIRVTRLSNEFDFADYREQHGGRAIPLLAWNDKGRVRVIGPDSDWVPGADWSVASLFPPESNDTGANA